jgi:hypothetical protein
MSMRFLSIAFSAAASVALCVACVAGPVAADDDDDNTTPMTQAPCLGTGRNHDEAYNNAYAGCRNIMNLACVVTGGRLRNVSVDSENDFDYGHNVYQVNLSLSADCVRKPSN